VSYNTDTSGTTIVTNTYSTDSTQVTGCTVTGTVATSTTVQAYPFCAAGSCTNCLARRDIPATTAVATHSIATASTGKPEEVSNNAQHSTLDRRDIPQADTAQQLYVNVRKSEDTIQVPIDTNGANIPQGISSSRYSAFGDFEFNLQLQGLYGCTSVVVVSRQGE
jgi:hypothetical protein